MHRLGNSHLLIKKKLQSLYLTAENNLRNQKKTFIAENIKTTIHLAFQSTKRQAISALVISKTKPHLYRNVVFDSGTFTKQPNQVNGGCNFNIICGPLQMATCDPQTTVWEVIIKEYIIISYNLHTAMPAVLGTHP